MSAAWPVRVRQLPLAAVLLAASLPAAAAATCTVSAVGVTFGSYDPLSANPAAAAGSLLATCTWTGGGSTTLSLTSSFSAGNSGSFPNRYMLSGTQRLNYNLYMDAAYTQIRGNGTAGTYTGGPAEVTVSSASRTATATGTIYGRIPAGQDVAPGSYTDTIIITINY